MLRSFTTVSALSLFLGCASAAPPRPAAEASPPLGSYSENEILEEVSDLARKLNLPLDKRVLVVERLRRLLASPDFQRTVADGVQGVMAYEAGEGGFVLKAGGGLALARLKGVQRDLVIDIDRWSLGAQLGGFR